MKRSVVLLERGEFSVVRLNGIARDPENGLHKRLVAVRVSDCGSRELARLLRSAADLLDQVAAAEVAAAQVDL